MLAAAILVAAFLNVLWSDIKAPDPSKATSGQEAPMQTKSRLRELDPESSTSRKRTADPALVKQWMDELLERRPELRVEIRDVPDHENGYLAWTNFSKEVMEGVEFPDCLSDYVHKPNDENRKCAEDWLNQNQNIELAIMEIAALSKQSMGNVHLDLLSSPGLGHFPKALRIMMARGLISAQDGDESRARAAFASVMNFVRHIDGIESPKFIDHVIAVGARGSVYQTFLDRIYPALGDDSIELSLWREALAPGELRDELTRALTGDNLRMASFLISNALSGEFDHIVDAKMTDAEIRTLIETGFEMKAHAIAAAKTASHLDSIPDLYAEIGNKNGLSAESLAFLNKEMEIMQSVVAAFLKKETQLMMYDAALAAAIGETMPSDPVSGKQFQWDAATMTLNAPEGTTPQKPLSLPAKR